VPDREPRDTEFSRLEIDRRILLAIDDLGFEACTPVQKGTLPHSLQGRDATGRAQTGTGKTAAFLITILQRFLADKDDRPPNAPFALVVAPTRELAIQIDSDAENLGKYVDFRHLVVYGGMNYSKQREEIQAGVDLIVATPGRLLDYMQQRVVDLSRVSVLVIDEADRMLDMGFIPDVRRIVRRLPPREQRQTMFYSATLTPEVLRLADSWLSDPVTVEIEPEQVVPGEVVQVAYAVPADDKLALLLWLLNNEAGDRVLVFRNRRDRSEELAHQLLRYGVNCSLLSGDVPQKKRLHVLEAFRQGRLRVIVATDVAGRGIHVDNISHVVNYDLPYEPEDYVHRIGRTGRAGETGRAVSFACDEGSFVLPEIEEYIKDQIPVEHPSPDMLKLPHPNPTVSGKQHTDLLPHSRPAKRRSGGGGGGRRGGRPRGGGRSSGGARHR